MDNDNTPPFAINLPPPDRFEPTTVVAKLEPNQRQINLLVIVLRIQANPQKTREGHEIHSFKVADRTGSVTLNVWNNTGKLISPGDILRLQNCITQVFKNELCVKPGRNGIVTKVGEFMMDFKEEPDMSIFSPSMESISNICIQFFNMIISLYNHVFRSKIVPKASEVLQCYIRHRNYPSWTSYFIHQYDCLNDQFGQSHFEFDVDGRNYHVLRTGCFPYIKYHCTQRIKTNDLSYENRLYTFFKIFNLGIPTLMYGLAAIFLIRHHETININQYGPVKIYFLIKENYGASF
ncbi:unnamed protein product [Rotaria magnacalcarata]|uniref:OB domain-containing protein n=7 Tax=Rotaria magnacalcarata TaxID=392030 RepID=A0A816QWC0_9BILA|nr:unnamed protein product [Rotaria magnacalcarata]CAF2066106.1 unnamed protein product [Rotaria magnacalcarata]CAF2145033.1 unnamed protein product [Rotaria magnacalcarata]